MEPPSGFRGSIPDLTDTINPCPVSAFDDTFALMYTGDSYTVDRAQEMLSKFQQSDKAFTRAYELLSESQRMETKFFALQIIDAAVLSRWYSFKAEERAGIKNVLIFTIVSYCTSPEQLEANRVLVTKLNTTLVSIAKREWPAEWPSFVKDLVESAQTPARAENTLRILSILGEEVFIYGRRTMTRRWIERKKRAVESDFSVIYSFCMNVLQAATEVPLVNTALCTLEKYIPWIDLNYVFEPPFLDFLTNRCVPHPGTRIVALQCLIEIASRSIDFEGNDRSTAQHCLILECVKGVQEHVIKALPPKYDDLEMRIASAAHRSGIEDRNYIDCVCQFLIAAYKGHLRYIQQDRNVLIEGHRLLVGITLSRDREMLKACAEYWNWLGALLTKSDPCPYSRQTHAVTGEVGVPPEWVSLLSILHNLFKNVRHVIIKSMPKPEEVMVVEDENTGEIRQEEATDVEELQLYELMKDALIYFTRLNPTDTCEIIESLMNEQDKLIKPKGRVLSAICWSVGSISGALDSKLERQLFLSIVKILLAMCFKASSTEDRAVMAANVMYVIGRYDRFLMNHNQFFRTVCKKLFQFMHEQFPGVNEMAVNTFYKLCKRVPSCFTTVDNGNRFIEVLLQIHMEPSVVSTAQEGDETNKLYVGVPAITSSLTPQLKEKFFESIGYVIAIAPQEQAQQYLAVLLQSVNAQFEAFYTPLKASSVAAGGDANGDIISTSDEVAAVGCCLEYSKELIGILRYHAAVAKSCGSVYLSQMTEIFVALKNYYTLYSVKISSEVASKGESVVSYDYIKSMRAVKREILRIIEFFISNTTNKEYVAQTCIPAILDLVLTDYNTSVPNARDPTVLALLGAIVKKMGTLVEREVPAMLNAVYDVTVKMFVNSQNMWDMPEHRINLFNFLEALCEHCFGELLRYCETNSDVIDGLLWAVRHTDHNVMTSSLRALDIFVMNVQMYPSSTSFNSTFLMCIIRTILEGIFDKMHASALQLHCAVLGKCINSGIAMPADSPAGGPAIAQTMRDFLAQYQALTPSQVDLFIDNCISAATTDSNEPDESKKKLLDIVKDMLIEMEVWGAAEENITSAEQQG